MTRLLPFAIALATLAGTIATAASPAAGGVAAVFPPWWSREAVLTAAAGTGDAVLGEGAIGSILLMHSESPGLPDRLRAHGAIIVLATAQLGGCLPASISRSRK